MLKKAKCLEFYWSLKKNKDFLLTFSDRESIKNQNGWFPIGSEVKCYLCPEEQNIKMYFWVK